MPCGNCLNGEQCNHVDGTCPGRCDPGWETNMCNTSKSHNLDLITVVPAKSDSDVMFCLQSYQGHVIDRSLVY